MDVTPRLDVHVEELVLDGVDPAAAASVRVAFEAALTRALAGVVPAVADAHVAHVAADVDVAPSTPEDLGARAGEAVAEAVGR